MGLGGLILDAIMSSYDFMYTDSVDPTIIILLLKFNPDNRPSRVGIRYWIFVADGIA